MYKQSYNIVSKLMTDEQARFALRLDKDLHKAFTDTAKAQDRNPSQLVREFMREYVKKHRQADLFKG